MLQAIRERTQGFIAWVIIILIAVPFAFWGIQNYYDVGKERPVAIVGDKEFLQRDANLAYQRLSQNPALISRFGEEELRRQAVEQLINDEVISQVSHDMGLTISDNVVREFNHSLPHFQTDGKFDRKKYNLVLSSQGKSSSGFVESVRKSLVMNQFRNAIIQSDFATDWEANYVIGLQNQEREIEYIMVPVVSVDHPLDDSAVDKYYRQHQDLFQNPEQVAIEYIELSLQKLADKIEPLQQQLLDYYESTKDLYTTQERRKVSHILIGLDADADQTTIQEAEKKAAQLKKRILAGESFAVIAKQNSDDKVSAKKGGDLDLLSPGDMEKNFESAAFALNQGEISDPVKTAFGYHLIKVTELKPSDTKPYEAVKDEISKAYRFSRAENQFYEQGERLAELSYENPDSLESAAQALNLEIKETPLFSRKLGEGIAADSKVRDSAFSEDVLRGNNSEPIELGDDKIVVLRPKEHKDAAVRPFVEVKNLVITKMKAQLEKDNAEKLANEIFKKVEEGLTLSDAAKEYNLGAVTSKTVSRKKAEIPLPIQKAVFKAPKVKDGNPDPLLAALDNGDHAIVRILAVKTASDPKSDEEQRKSIKNALSRVSGHSMYSTLVSSVRDNVSVRTLSPDE